MARLAYDRDEVRFADPVVAEYGWLVSTNRDLFALSLSGVKAVLHGWFFGICREGPYIYLFENCAMWDRTAALGRIVRLTLAQGRLAEPRVLVRGLHSNCHQIRIIDDLLCLVDSANQQVLRFTRDGSFVDAKRPFPVAPPSDTSGAYLHMNSIARVGGQIAIMLHNGKAVPDQCSRLAWLKDDWSIDRIDPVAGHYCHDIVEDDDGTIWHCASREGELLSGRGLRLHVANNCLTRGLAITADHLVVGQSGFGPREQRDLIGGRVSIYDKALEKIAESTLPSGPTDIVSLP